MTLDTESFVAFSVRNLFLSAFLELFNKEYRIHRKTGLVFRLLTRGPSGESLALFLSRLLVRPCLCFYYDMNPKYGVFVHPSLFPSVFGLKSRCDPLTFVVLTSVP